MGDSSTISRAGGDMATDTMAVSCRRKRRVRGALVRIAAATLAAALTFTTTGGGVSAQQTTPAPSSSSPASVAAVTGTPTPPAPSTPTPTAATNAGVSASTTSPSSSATSVGKYVLQRNMNSADGNSIVEIVHMKDGSSDTQMMGQFAPIAAVSDWTLNTWEAVLPTLETTVKAATPTLTYLELNVQFQSPSAVQNLQFEHDTTWSLGPALVLDENALSGLTGLKTLYVCLHFFYLGY